jgi:LPS-assembly lipoprotein
MSWLNKRNLPLLFALLLPVALSACGFQPVYGTPKGTTPDSRLNAGVKIEPIPGKLGQIFKNHLEDQLSPAGGIPASPAYRLVVKMDYVTVPISVARDGTVSRYNINFNSDYVLYRNADDKPITSGSIGYLTSYNNLTNIYFSTYQSQDDALKRGTLSLAVLYRQRIISYLDEGAPVAPVIHLPGKKDPIPADSLLRQQQGTSINLPQN